MRIEGFSTGESSPAAAAAALVARIRLLGGIPDFIFIATSHPGGGDEIREVLMAQLPGSPFLGTTSEKGVFANDPQMFDDRPALSALIFFDPSGAYAVFSGLLGTGGTESVRHDAEAALERAGRKGEMPDLIFFLFGNVIHQQPLLAQFEAMFGRSVPIFGGGSGKAGDSTCCFTPEGCHSDGAYYAAVLFYPSCCVVTRYRNFFGLSSQGGFISRSEGCRILEINNRPALDMYREWLTNYFPRDILTRNDEILRELINSHPLGVPTGMSADDVNYQNFCITDLGSDGTLITYAHLRNRTRVVLLLPLGRDETVARYRQTLECNAMRKNMGEILGMLTVTCFLLREQLMPGDVSFLADLENPVAGFFSRGEHGRFSNDVNADSNLMMANIIFCTENWV